MDERGTTLSHNLKLENPIRPNANQALKAKIKRLDSNDCVFELTNNSLKEIASNQT